MTLIPSFFRLANTNQPSHLLACHKHHVRCFFFTFKCCHPTQSLHNCQLSTLHNCLSWSPFLSFYPNSRAILRNPDITGESPVTDLFVDDFWGTRLTHSGSHKSYRPLCVLSFRWNHMLASNISGESRPILLACLLACSIIWLLIDFYFLHRVFLIFLFFFIFFLFFGIFFCFCVPRNSCNILSRLQRDYTLYETVCP